MADPKIFVSYRRSDSGGWTGRVCDRLEQHFSDIFRDVEAIERGADFLRTIEEAIARCDVMLVVIGPDWLTTTTAEGRRRLDVPEDVVRKEVEWALARDGLRVIPLLIGGGKLPSKSALPETLRPLAARNSMELRADRFEDDLEELVRQLGGGSKLFGRSRVTWAAGAALVAAVVAAVVLSREKDERRGEHPVAQAVQPATPIAPSAAAPAPPPRMSGDFNVAVADFATDSTEMETKDALAALGKQVHQTLDGEMAELRKGDYQVELRAPEKTGTLAGETPEARADAAAKLADQIGADVVLYGHLGSGDSSSFVPEFYLSSRRLGGAEELVGQYAFGTPIALKGKLTNPAVARGLRQVLRDRTKALAHFVAGLGYYAIHELEEAQKLFERAEADEGWDPKDGKEVLYVLLGNVAGLQGDLKRADAQYVRGLELDPSYARGLLGRAEVLYHQSNGGCQRGKVKPKGLGEAEATFHKARAAKHKPPRANVDIKAALGLGRIYRCMSQAGLKNQWDAARTELKRVLAAPDADQLRELKAFAHAELALAEAPAKHDAPGARKAYAAAVAQLKQAVALTRVDVRKEEFERQLKFYEERLGSLPDDDTEAGPASAGGDSLPGAIAMLDNANAFHPRDVPPPLDASRALTAGYTGAARIAVAGCRVLVPEGADAQFFLSRGRVPVFKQITIDMCPGKAEWTSLFLEGPDGKRRPLAAFPYDFTPGAGDPLGVYRVVTEKGVPPKGRVNGGRGLEDPLDDTLTEESVERPTELRFEVVSPDTPIVRLRSLDQVFPGSTLRIELAGFVGSPPPPVYLYQLTASAERSFEEVPLKFISRLTAHVKSSGQGSVTLPLPKDLPIGAEYCVGAPGGCANEQYTNRHLDNGGRSRFTIVRRPPPDIADPPANAAPGEDGSRYVVLKAGSGERPQPGDVLELTTTYWSFQDGNFEHGGIPAHRVVRVPAESESREGRGAADIEVIDSNERAALSMVPGEQRRVWFRRWEHMPGSQFVNDITLVAIRPRPATAVPEAPPVQTSTTPEGASRP